MGWKTSDWLGFILYRGLAELDGRATLSNLERKELLWLKRNRGHETFVYLNKIHAIQRSQDKLSATRNCWRGRPEAYWLRERLREIHPHRQVRHLSIPRAQGR